jgi:nucleotide-binding universal stress UspA family protein
VFTHILIGVDGSEHGQAAIREAVDIAMTQGASLSILTVYSTLLAWPATMGAGIPQEVLDDFAQGRLAEARETLEETVASLPTGVEAHTLMVESTNPGSVILEESERGGHDLVVPRVEGPWRRDIAAPRQRQATRSSTTATSRCSSSASPTSSSADAPVLEPVWMESRRAPRPRNSRGRTASSSCI